MEPNEMATLLRYNEWANKQVLDAAAKLTPEQYLSPQAGTSFGNVHGALVHAFRVERNWRGRAEGNPAGLPAIPDDQIADLSSLTAKWNEEAGEMRRFAGSLSSEKLSSPVAYRAGETEASAPMWLALSNVVNHGTQFRGEAAVGLTALGQSPGNLDFIYYARTQGANA